MRLNDTIIAGLPTPEKGNKVHWFSGAKVAKKTAPRGFGVRVMATGVRSPILNYRVGKREYRYTIGRFPEWGAERAVDRAQELRRRIDRGENPLDDRAPAPTVKTMASVLDDFLARHVRGKLRSATGYENTFKRLVTPRIGRIGIQNLRRSHIVEMLDEIADASGPVMADRSLSYLRKALNWYAVRDQGNRRRNFLARGRDSDSDRELDGSSRGMGWTGFAHVFPEWKIRAPAMLAAMICRSCW
ncbi:MAG TPA: Arm DNA-binding domain-containing protein [Stellaceae bacterium]